ncbi:hypothetical protein SCP_0604840 [Sparassis crispa]|uniref:Uncharacterized protein n=1 Tax=Sparassis crispa TaxID=139825 RepID=A0A401GQM7_9APHY|nr:hypothetical protein SCP_0604840 [Sparassis crispa]GBE84505.1 hypothetical protein SCP_0604840 [Sparassis crispa]
MQDNSDDTLASRAGAIFIVVIMRLAARPTTTSPPPSHFHHPARWNACHTLQEGMEVDTDDTPASSAGASFVVVIV